MTSGFQDVLNFGTDVRFGNPTRVQIRERLSVIKEIQKASGFEFPAGVVFDLGEGAIDLRQLALDNISRRNIDTIGMLEKYSEVMGMKMPQEIKDALQGLDKSFVWDFADEQISRWLGTGSELMSAAMSRISSTPLGNGTMQIGMELAGSLQDGYMSDAEIRSVATTTGAVIGGAVGSIIPGIGTAVGTLVGSTIGMLVGEVITWYTEPRWEKVMQEMRKEAEKASDLLRGSCLTAERDFNENYVARNIYQLSDLWHNTELTLGFRIPLRWFDANPGLPFVYKAWTTNNPARYPLNALYWGTNTPPNMQPESYLKNIAGWDFRYGKFECRTAYRNRQGTVGPYAGKDWRVTGDERVGSCNFYCPSSLLGCLYPEPVAGLFGPFRVMSAMQARGFQLPLDMGCANIGNVSEGVDCRAKFKNADGSDEEKEQMCRDYIRTLIKSQAGELEKSIVSQQKNFITVLNLVSQDITRTAALMKSQNDIFANRVALAKPGKIITPATQLAAARLRHVRNMKNLSMAGGAGVLGLALWRTFR